MLAARIKLSEDLVAMHPAASHRLRQPGIVINTNGHVRIRYPQSRFLEHIGHVQCAGMPRALHQSQVQRAVSGNAGLLFADEFLRLLDQPVQADKITFIQRHQSRKTG